MGSSNLIWIILEMNAPKSDIRGKQHQERMLAKSIFLCIALDIFEVISIEKPVIISGNVLAESSCAPRAPLSS